MSAVNVGILILVGLSSIDIREFTLEKGLMSARNVGNPLPGALSFVVIRVHPGE